MRMPLMPNMPWPFHLKVLLQYYICLLASWHLRRYTTLLRYYATTPRLWYCPVLRILRRIFGLFLLYSFLPYLIPCGLLGLYESSSQAGLHAISSILSYRTFSFTWLFADKNTTKNITIDRVYRVWV